MAERTRRDVDLRPAMMGERKATSNWKQNWFELLKASTTIDSSGDNENINRVAGRQQRPSGMAKQRGIHAVWLDK